MIHDAEANTPCHGYAARDAASPLQPYSFTRRALRPDDVNIEIRYCGVCHSDLHQARNDWRNTIYPCVPGHEIVGQVVAIGPRVSRFTPGEWVAVGCLVDSCKDCSECDAGREQYCQKGATLTYNGKDRQSGEITFGGYSTHVVVRDEFVLKVPAGLDPARAAPLLCAGITTYSPLRHWRVGPGSKVAVVGLGGLGHMGVKLANGMGAEVTVVTRSADKAAEARSLGAHHMLLSSDAAAMKAAMGRFDMVLDTVPVVHEVDLYLRLVRAQGAMVLVGVIDTIPAFHSGYLIGARKTLSGSAIGGIAETQELLDFCADKGILAECEMTTIQQINEAYERMEKGDVRYRFVIDMQSLRRPA
jgi:alcohol dehydrogenase (NADP+)